MDAPKAAVFLSYASADAAAARRIADALRAAGVETWLDESALRGGDAWDAAIRAQIRDCALFVPIVSAHTEARSEGYFRLEWRLAIERSRLIADDRPFLVPVVIDDTRDAGARVPEAFLERQWTRLRDEPDLEAFAARVRHILDEPGAPSRSATTISQPRFPARFAVVVALALAAVVAAGGWFWLQRRPVAPLAATTPAAPMPEVAASPKTIAVPPFENLSGRPEDAYLADGLQEEILNALARVHDLTVISRTSTREYRGSAPNLREIGRKLGVGSVLEGSIRRDGETLRLTVQLVDARDDAHLFAANYDRDLGRLLDLQSEVARQVATALSATLTQYERGELERVPTTSGDAYDRYLHAVALLRQESPQDYGTTVEPMRLLDEAVALDSEFADAWALRSQLLGWRYFAAEKPEDAAAAKTAFERAEAIDPDVAEAKLARGIYGLYVVHDLDRAIMDFESYAKVRPSSGLVEAMLGYALRRKSRFDEALAHFERAWIIDPLNFAYSGGALTTLLALRHYPEAIARIDTFMARFPEGMLGFFTKARIEGQIRGGDIEPLKQALAKYGRRIDDKTRAEIEGEIARAEGRYRDAIALWQKIEFAEPPMRHQALGILYLAAGDSANAAREFAALEQSAKETLAATPNDTNALGYRALAESMRGAHDAALATIDEARKRIPESDDVVNGPRFSVLRALLLLRAGRVEVAHAELERLLHVPFATPFDFFSDTSSLDLLVKDDAPFQTLLHHAPRL